MIIGYQKRVGNVTRRVLPRERRSNLLKRAFFMKDDIHPEYRPVVFKDDSTGYTFVTRSTMSSDRVIELEDGTEYPLVKLDISSSSHPFYTGQQRLVDTAGRVERFRRRYSQQHEKVEGASMKAEGAGTKAEGAGTEKEGSAVSDGAADASSEDVGADAEQ